MTVIYAFQDRSGHWHGDPDAPLLDPADQPGRGILTYQPVPGTPEAASPFAGQRLTVLYGVTDLEAGPVTYQLDTGGRFLATWHIHTLLASPMGTAPLPAPSDTPSGPLPAPCLESAFTENGHRYVLTGTRCDNGQLTLELTISSERGDIHGELCGAVTADDLAPLARLLDAASRTRAPAIPSPRQGGGWAPADSARLAARFRQERDFTILTAEFGRSRSVIYEELTRQGLIRTPGSDRTTPVSRPLSEAMQQRRQVHRNTHTRWNNEEERQLAQRCADGVLTPELSNEFGRSEQAIDARLLKIGAVGPAADQARLNAL
ncbi:hypothetical protein GCM10023084_77120 [Streptomyces lacrimifluminis]|uniref:Uncharacterized protein n=1 Tax=Streptomyces lacrimifluminis TaxID=1500077 RepID=A0A917P8R4_9ACTN|nr:hypothetical protein [Streptomyces lacrimifluminis]GGJ66954.1 hypothetical protein GCM10012282_74880 [Streptomyces lacrimifluminis]